MAEQPNFIARQYAFAAHIRDPEHVSTPEGVEDRRMAIYRDLFYNNVESLLSGFFPVLRRILTDDHWHAMVRDFFIRHRAQTPLFLELAQEFLDYLQNERETNHGDPAFLIELTHYEWVELALSISDDEPNPSLANPNGDLMEGCPIVSPLAWNLSYRFPVHQISPDFQPQTPGDQPTHLVVYCNRANDVEFLEINAVTQRLLQLLKENLDWTGLKTVKRIAKELQHPQPELVIQAGEQQLNELRTRNIILGTRQAT